MRHMSNLKIMPSDVYEYLMISEQGGFDIMFDLREIEQSLQLYLRLIRYYFLT